MVFDLGGKKKERVGNFLYQSTSLEVSIEEG